MNPSNFEGNHNPNNFIAPSLQEEKGEIERVAVRYSPNNTMDFKRKFLEAFEMGILVDLTDDMWSKLENTDSFDIAMGGWQQVKGHVDHGNETTGASRDWENLKQKIERGEEIDAPIVLKYGETLHLLSGNTRLMVARALGKTPKVFLVEINTSSEEESK